MPKQDRWFDQADFTPEHDKMMLWLMKKWKAVVLTVAAPLVGIPNDRSIELSGHFRGEPILNGYPPVFPDGIATGRLTYDHRDRPIRRVEDYRGAYWRCGYPHCPETCTTPHDAATVSQGSELFWRYCCRGPRLIAILEIKPRIDSFGSVLRQLNLYRARCCDRKTNPSLYSENTTLLPILITPDRRYDEAFREQGVNVVHPDFRADEAVYGACKGDDAQ